MPSEIKQLEELACHHVCQKNLEEAFKLYRQAAESYRSIKNHKQAALCFASAASCWSITSGEKTFYNSASCYEDAAAEAEDAHDFEYASLMYKYAAINYERDMEFVNFSDCFYHSKENHRKYLYYSFIHPRKLHHVTATREDAGTLVSLRHFLSWILLSFSYFVWGHGERPVRAFATVISIILAASVFYSLGYSMKSGIVQKLDFLHAFYLSVVTFATIGYGDITPVGFGRVIAVIQAFSGLFIMPLFMISLARKYLRI